MICAVKTTASHEETVAEMIADREPEGVHAVLAPEDMTSYILVEAEDPNSIKIAIDEIPHARELLEQQTSIASIQHFLEPKSDVENIAEGDVVELTDGPFKGEKAQVQRIDDSKEQVTVELYEATVPIPVTVRGDQLRRLDSEER